MYTFRRPVLAVPVLRLRLDHTLQLLFLVHLPEVVGARADAFRLAAPVEAFVRCYVVDRMLHLRFPDRGGIPRDDGAFLEPRRMRPIDAIASAQTQRQIAAETAANTAAKRFLMGVTASNASTKATTKFSMKSKIGVAIGP